MRWLVIVSVLGLLGVGLWLDGHPDPGQPVLFWSLTAASAVGWLGGLAVVGKRWMVPVAAVVWRLAVFPILVFSGFIASVSEWLTLAIGAPVVVYPAFLMAVALLHGGAIVALSVALKRRWMLAVAIPLLLNAALVSFTAAEDLTLLPDGPWETPRAVPAPQAPVSNPYLPLLSTDRTIPQNTLLLCAGMTWPLIPPSPWASTVQGTLEGLTHANPDASSSDRIAEHYLAYLAAHSRIRSR